GRDGIQVYENAVSRDLMKSSGWRGHTIKGQPSSIAFRSHSQPALGQFLQESLAWEPVWQRNDSSTGYFSSEEHLGGNGRQKSWDHFPIFCSEYTQQPKCSSEEKRSEEHTSELQ